MKYLISILLIHNFLFSFAQTSAQAKILQAETRRFEAMVQRDTATLQKIISDDLIYLHSNNLKENKQEHISNIGAGKLVYQKMIREDANIRRYGKTAINNGKVHVTGILNAAPFEVLLSYTAVYHKRKHIWQLVSWQSTRIP